MRQKNNSARTIQRERFGIDFDPPPPLSVERPSDWLGKIIKKAGLTDKIWEHELVRDWKSIVGEIVAGHSRPGQYTWGTLTIFVDSSPWLNNLHSNFK